MAERPGHQGRARIALRRAGPVLAFVLLAVLAIRLAGSWGELRERGVRIRFPWLGAAVLGYVLIQIVHASVFRWMLGRFGPRPTLRATLGVCGRAWLGRYLPGRLWVVGGKVLLGTRLGFTRRTLAVVSLTQLCLIVLVAGTYGSACLLGAAALGLPSLPGGPVALVLLLGFAALSPPVFRRVLNLAARLTGRPLLEPAEVLSLPALAGAAVRMLGACLVGSTTWLFLLLAFFPPDRISAELFLLAAGSGPIGAVAGMAAVFAPAGLGVREGATAGLLTAALSPGEAIALALLARVNSLLGDAVYFAVSQWLGRRAPTRER